MKILFFTSRLILIFLAFFPLSGCGTKTIDTMPPIDQKEKPSKQLPERAKIPRTQHPYHIMGKTYYPIPSAYGFNQSGIASWYGTKFHGRKTSNGEVYDMYAETAAHKTLPMNTRLMVENLENGKKTFVRVNDRGPFVKDRIIDLSLTAAKKIGIDIKGTGKVKITAMGEAIKSRSGNETVEHFLPYQNFTDGDFFVQIGSFTQKNNADRLKDSMLAQGKKTVIQSFDLNGTTFYRVQVRGGHNLDSAYKIEKELSTSFPGAFVIAR